MSEKQNNEIDLLDLFLSFKDWVIKLFISLFKLLVGIFIFILRKWFYLFIGLIISAVLSIFLSKTQKDVFFSDLVLKTNILDNQEMISYINRLQDLTIEENYELLGELINIPINEAENVKSIVAYWYVDKNRDGIVDGIDLDNRFILDTLVDKVGWKFGIRAEVSDPRIFEVLADGIFSYVNRNPYFVEMNLFRLENLRETIDQGKIELEKLDSLQRKEYFTIDESLRLKEGQFIFTNDREIKLLHPDVMELLKEKQRNEMQLQINEGIISLLEDFTVNREPANDLGYYVKTITPYLIGLMLLLSIIVHYRRNIFNLFKD